MDSIIFDLDGTIWDSIDTVLFAWNSILKRELNSELSRADFEETMGLQMDEISRKLFPTLSDEQRKQLVKECCEVETIFLEKEGGALFGNVENVLQELSKKYKLYIVSNCQDDYIEVFYKYHNLEKYFLDFENPGRTGLSKGENINLIIERNNLSTPVYVGDTEGDLKAARFANIPFVYAKYGFGQVSEYEEVIDNFEDLLRIF
ncbi:HAD family hydrolase [Planomicrobium sp. Y74]|uniref:HAD family hydrolase n=1 Tax=Planomicrobium sp. Y74 TaxID=2478977 RepID=UPI000EF4ADC4|nr:HAD family hydrolase [Planomicrobium sp. Y74]RLQ83887.1 HAD family hydrolase [Planomicrobium sp. Y74]